MWHADDQEGDKECGAEEGGGETGAGVKWWGHGGLKGGGVVRRYDGIMAR